MKRVAIIAEGQTEAIFVRELLFRVIDPSEFSFSYIKLNADRMERVREYSSPNPEIHFQIINVQNDERVLSVIKDMETGLVESGLFGKILGIRDMYSQEYDDLSNGAINDHITTKIMEKQNDIIQTMTYRNIIKLYYCIMEIEAWFLSMYNVFLKLDPKLTVEYIEENLGFNLKRIDPQKEFFKPSRQLNEIFELCQWKYRKSEDNIEKFVSRIEVTDIDNAKENNRCSCFNDFYQGIKNPV